MKNKVCVKVYGCNKAQYLEWTRIALNSLFNREFSDADVISFVDNQLQTKAYVRPGESVLLDYDFPEDKQFLPLEFDSITATVFHNQTLNALREFGTSNDASINADDVCRFMKMQLQTEPGATRAAKFFLDRGSDADEDLLYRTIDSIGHYQNWDRVSGELINFVFYPNLGKARRKRKFVVFFIMQDEPGAFVSFSKLNDQPLSKNAFDFEFYDIPRLESMDLDMPAGLNKEDLMAGHAELMKFYDAIKAEPELAKHFIMTKCRQ